MTERGSRFSISVPPDVARDFNEQANVSAYVTEAVRSRRRRKSTRDMLSEAGYDVTDEGVERMAWKLAHLDHQNEGGHE